MKFGTIASLCVAASLGAAQAAPFDNLMSLIQQLQDEATALSTEYGAKDDEIAALMAQLSKCEGGDDTSSASVEEDSSSAATSSAPTAPTPTPTPEPTPTVTSAKEPEEEEGEEEEENEPSAPSSGDFSFSLGQSWNYNLASPYNVDVDVDVFFIDMDAGQSVIDELHGKGKGVVCYISIGTVEDWREDSGEFPSEAIGGGVAGWAGERWLDVNNAQVREIMAARVQKAKGMNCDAVEPDNMMVYTEGSVGVDVSEADQIDYNNWFADVVHEAGMLVGLKNAVELVPILVNKYDFALNEECHEWNECGIYKDTFLAEGKPVFNVEYNLGKSVCEEANALGLDTILKEYDLKPPFCSCVDSSRDLDCMF